MRPPVTSTFRFSALIWPFKSESAIAFVSIAALSQVGAMLCSAHYSGETESPFGGPEDVIFRHLHPFRAIDKLKGPPKIHAAAEDMHIDWSAVAIVIATIMGPILAVQAQKYLERHRDQKRAKDAIFRVLMATRANRLAPDHVQALNGIELAFYGGRGKEKRIREAWKAYHDHLNDKSYQPNRTAEWATRQIDLFIDLLHEMAVCLGYDFDKTHIKNSWYAPEAHGTIEQQWNDIRGALADILTGKRFFPVVGFAASDDEAKEMAEVRKRLIEWLKINTQIPQAVLSSVIEPGLSSQAQLPSPDKKV